MENSTEKRKQFKYETVFDKKSSLPPIKVSMIRNEGLEKQKSNIIIDNEADLVKEKISSSDKLNQKKVSFDEPLEKIIPETSSETSSNSSLETSRDTIHDTLQDILPKNTQEIIPEKTLDSSLETIPLEKKNNEVLDTDKQINDKEIKNSTKKDFENSLTLEDIHINLRLLSKIEVGDKLILNGKYISIDTSYAQFITRWYYGASRTDSLQFINIILNKAIKYNIEFSNSTESDAPHNLFRLTSELKNCLNGLTNLKQTYYSDKLIQSEIDVIIENVLAKIDYKQIIS